MGLQITGHEPGRNESCPCGSGLKYKYCHGDESKRLTANRVANLAMSELILHEQKKRGFVPWEWKCKDCEHGFDRPKMAQTIDGYICPKCDSTNIEQNVKNKSEEKDANNSQKETR